MVMNFTDYSDLDGDDVLVSVVEEDTQSLPSFCELSGEFMVVYPKEEELVGVYTMELILTDDNYNPSQLSSTYSFEIEVVEATTALIK